MGKGLRLPAAAWAGGALYALLAAFGWQAERWGGSRPWAALLWALALFVPFSLLLARLFALGRGDARESRPFRCRRAFLGMLLCWLPSFVIHFPGSFAYDVPFQLEQTASGVFSSHHPLVHTLLMGSLVELGRKLGSANLGAALYTAVQMIGLAACLTAVCASLARQSGSRTARAAACFFALYPLHMLMAVNATKDVLFSGFFALALALLREELSAGLTAGRRALLFVSAAAAALLRNNMGWAMAAAAAVLALASLKSSRPAGRAAAVLALALAASAGVNGLLSAALGAAPGDAREMLSWPIQQAARASCREREKLSDAEKEAVDDLMPQMIWKQYDPTVSDPVKFGFRTERLRENPQKYLAAYVSLLKKCPQSAFDAVLMLTHAWLYPCPVYRVSGYYLQTWVTQEDYTGWQGEHLSDGSPFPQLRQAVEWRFGAKGAMQIPLLGWCFNMGVIVWLTLFFALRGFAEEGKAGLAGVLPLMLLATFLLGPVMAGRYIYPFVCALPVLAGRTRKLKSSGGENL